MKPKEVFRFLTIAVNSPVMPAIHLWGPPGIGKSRVCQSVAEEAEIGFIDMRLSMKDPTDIKGLPAPEHGKAKWLPPSELPTEGKGLLFLDELNLAPPLVQASAYQLVLDRKVGEYILPKGWRIIAAGNKAEHGANVFKMAAPLRNRFIHIDFEHDLDDWTEWAITNGIASEVVEFVRFRPDHLFAFKPDKHENAFPTPRTWEFVSQIMPAEKELGPELLHNVIKGTVGDGAALEFKSYLQVRKSLPNIDEILAGKDHFPHQIDVGCALATALVIRAKPSQFERLLQYSQGIGTKEIAILMIRLMSQKDKNALLTAPSWKKMASEYYSLIF